MTAERHLTEAALAAGLPEVLRAPIDSGTLVLIVVRPGTELRELPERWELSREAGVAGDRWAQSCTRRLADGRLDPDTQLTLMNARVLALLAGNPERWPLAGDNLIVDLNLDQANLPTGQRLSLGEAVIEITAYPHNGCAKFSKRFGEGALKFVNSTEGKRLRLRGVYAQVIEPGRIRVGDRITRL